MAVGAEDRHGVVIARGRDGRRYAGLLDGNVDRLLPVVAHIGDGFEPAGEEGFQRLGIAGNQIIARIDDMDVEVFDAVAEFDQDAAVAGLHEFVDGHAVGGHAVDLMGLQRGDLRLRGAKRRDLDAVVAPALRDARIAG